MKEFYFTSYQAEIGSVKEVLSIMQLIDDELNNTNFSNLRAFNTTYQIITKNVFAKLGKGYFKDDHLMQRVDITFAKYYFNALKSYVDNRPVDPAWQILFDTCRRGKRYQFIYMALGVNAHVNNDLPLTLSDLNGDECQEDYDRVNEVISDSIDEAIYSLQEDSTLLNKAENNATALYSSFLTALIKQWRSDAWESYKKYAVGGMKRRSITRNAQEVAEHLSSITSMTKVPKVLQLLNKERVKSIVLSP